jgi:site-specific DNA recombinase
MGKDLEEYLKLGISFLHGIDKLYKNSTSDIKKKVVGSIFPEKLVFEKNIYRTACIYEFIAHILSKHKPFKLLKIKTPHQKW